jgi:ketosteroid isomerase-like protein
LDEKRPFAWKAVVLHEILSAMSDENVELIRRLIPPPEVDVATLLRDDALFDQMKAELDPFIDPEVESVALWEPGAAERSYVGIEGFRRLWLDWLEPWAEYHVGVEELVDSGDRVVALIRDRGRRADMDAEVEITAGSLWTIRDGKVSRVEFCTREDALAAAERPT